MLRGDEACAPAFASLVEGCLQRSNATRYVVAVTLWIDSDCAL
jgi:hypothetical protein